MVGGDSRDDIARVMPWALKETKARGATAMLFLGDMEHKPEQLDHFVTVLADLSPVPFYPVLGNHDAIYRKSGTEIPREKIQPAIAAYKNRFLGTAGTPVKSAFEDKIVYSVDLPGGLHFVALDNVTQPGFGAEQLAWLTADLAKANAAGARHVVIGMHKALAGSGVTMHAMDEDGPSALADSRAALELFEKSGVEIIFASHFHGFAEYSAHGIRSFITGGLGAPLDNEHGDKGRFHHFIQLDVRPDAPLETRVVRFEGKPSIAPGHDE